MRKLNLGVLLFSVLVTFHASVPYVFREWEDICEITVCTMSVLSECGVDLELRRHDFLQGGVAGRK